MSKYKGKRSFVTFPPELYDLIKRLSEKETRSFSGMVVVLVKEALVRRGLLQEEDEEA